MTDAIHKEAAAGYAAGVEHYERGRPDYPTEAVDFLVSELGIQPRTTLIEIGAGTGKLTKQLVPSGATIIAVEPVAAMRKKFAESLPDIGAVPGTAEELPFSDSWVNAVVAAQSFHWFDGEKALGEIHRVLRPGGRLAMLWNVRDESTDWVAKLTEIIDAVEAGAPRYKTGRWREAFERSSLFTPLQSRSFSHFQSGPPETIVDRVASISFIAALEKDSREAVLQQVRELLRTHPDTRGKSEVTLPYRTEVFWCEKRV